MTLSIQWEETVWSLVALVGLGFDIYNAREAKLDLSAALGSHQDEASLLWARFSRLLHPTLGAVKLAFILAGVIAMLRRPSPDASQASRLLVLVLLVGASALLTNVSVRWTRVHVAISEALRRRGSPADRRAP